MQRAVVQKVKGDLAAEETMMEEYTKWCDSESNEKEDAITSHKRTIGDLEAEIADATARISELGTEVEELAGKISGAESELSEATKLREEEKATFAASESELVDTVDSLERALVVLKRGQTSFLQARDQDTLKKMTMSLSHLRYIAGLEVCRPGKMYLFMVIHLHYCGSSIMVLEDGEVCLLCFRSTF